MTYCPSRTLIWTLLVAALLLIPTSTAVADDDEGSDPAATADDSADDTSDGADDTSDSDDAAADAPQPDDDLVKTPLRVRKGINIELYGFVRIDMNFSDALLTDTQIPIGVVDEAENTFSLYPRLSALGLALDKVRIEELGADVTAKIELDFYAFNTSDSRNQLRMRKVYSKLDFDFGMWFLAGQNSDIVSQLYPNVSWDLIAWQAGNLGDRRPQMTLGYDLDAGALAVHTAVEFGMPNAVDNKDLDSDGNRDGELAGFPAIMYRLAFDFKPADDHVITVAAWGFYAREKLTTAINGKLKFEARAWGVEINIPIIPGMLWIKAEGFIGENLTDLRGGAGFNQGINSTTGEEITTNGGWVEISAKPCDCLMLYAGATLDDPRNNETFNTGDQRVYNMTAYGVAALTFGTMTFGLEYTYWQNHIFGTGNLTANRIKFFVMYAF